MKIVMYLNLIALILAPGFSIAQDAPHKTDVAINLMEPAVASPLPIEQDQHSVQSTPDTPADDSLIALNTFYARSQFMDEPNLSSAIKQTVSAEPSILDGWRERIFKSLKAYYGPIQQDRANDNRLLNNSALDEQANNKSVVAKLVLKETFNYTQEQVPEIDRMVKALKFEVSTENVNKEDAVPAMKNEAGDKEAVEKGIAKKKSVDEKLFVKTGLRIPIESGKPTLVSETEARYHKLSSFIKVRLDGQYDNSLGVTYILGKDIHLQAERQVTHMTTTDPASQDKMNTTSSLNLVQLVCKF
jgi:hypothetical protein